MLSLDEFKAYWFPPEEPLTETDFFNDIFFVENINNLKEFEKAYQEDPNNNLLYTIKVFLVQTRKGRMYECYWDIYISDVEYIRNIHNMSLERLKKGY
jgi:hypothetical protein